LKNNSRPDLPNHAILVLLVLSLIALIITLTPIEQASPGTVNRQWAGAIGALLLFAPFLFTLLKRSGLSASPPFWFVIHVLCASAGAYLIFFHAAGGDWMSPPGLVLILMIFLLVQGSFLRVSVSNRFSHLFARTSIAPGFARPQTLDKAHLKVLIEYKQQLLQKLDPRADEALFSPNLRHWLQHPWLSLRYQRLISVEADVIGARAGAGLVLAWSRRLHMLAATLFYLGLVAHIIVVLFFAGYASGGDEIDWWYITDYGATGVVK